MPDIDPQVPIFDAEIIFEKTASDGRALTVYGMFADNIQIYPELISRASGLITRDMRAKVPLICSLVDVASGRAKTALAQFDCEPDRAYSMHAGETHQQWYERRSAGLANLMADAMACMEYAVDVATGGGAASLLRPVLVSKDDYVYIGRPEGDVVFEFVITDNLGVRSSDIHSEDSTFLRVLVEDGIVAPEDLSLHP